MKYRIHSMKPESFRIFNWGDVLPEANRLTETHTFLTNWTVEDAGIRTGLEVVFDRFQSENWSPNGEASDLILAKGLRHTSMSVGDVIEDEDGIFWAVRPAGFAPLEWV
jgi:hypothetical protein